MNSALFDHLEKIYAFRVVVELGSIRKAANILRVAQPSITRSIQILEAVLGTPLLIRSKQGVEATTAGRHLLELSRSIADKVDEFQLKLDAPNAKWAGKVKIGTYEYLIKLLWSDILLKSKTDFPSLQLHIAARSSFVPQSTAINEFDLIVDVEPVTSKELLSVKLMTDVFAFYCSSQLPTKQSQRIADLDLVYVPSAIDGSRMTLYESLVKFDLSPRSTYEVDTFETCRHLAISQLGVTILPKSVGDQEVKRKTLRPLTSIGIPKGGFGPHMICATFRKSQKDDPKIQLLLNLLQHQTSQIKGS
jgi:LysR family nitrogen assimilation transcriptional regulator